MTNPSPETWRFFVFSQIDTLVFPKAKQLADQFLSDHGTTRGPSSSLVQGILQRANALQTIDQAFTPRGRKADQQDDFSFETFLLNRAELEERRGHKMEQQFYKMVYECLAGQSPFATKRLTASLLKTTKVGKDLEQRWRSTTQIILLKAWVQGICYRTLMRCAQKGRHGS